jgi:hypothetical protein
MELVPLVYTALTVVTVLGAITIIISYISFKVRTKGKPKAKEHTEIIEAERRRAMPARITKMIRKQQKAIQEPRPQKNISNSRLEEHKSREEKLRSRREDLRQRREEPDRREDTRNSRNVESNRRPNSSGQREDNNRRNDNPNFREDRKNYRENERRNTNENRNMPPSPPTSRKEFYEERPNESRIRIIKQLKPEDETTHDRDSDSLNSPTTKNKREISSSKESKKYQSLGDDVIKKYDGEDDDEFFTLDTDDKK